jgi:hypothetical protein
MFCTSHFFNILKLNALTEENVQLQKMLASIVDEAGARVKEEVENIKQQYNKKLEVLLHDMKKMEDVGNYVLLYIAPSSSQQNSVRPPFPTHVVFTVNCPG